VKEEWCGKDFSRKNSDIERYNQKAVEVLTPLGVEINDLYSVTQDFDDSLRSDFVHFKEEGCKILADAVIEKIL
jgi:lysophospholipase L1-like esterase